MDIGEHVSPVRALNLTRIPWWAPRMSRHVTESTRWRGRITLGASDVRPPIFVSDPVNDVNLEDGKTKSAPYRSFHSIKKSPTNNLRISHDPQVLLIYREIIRRVMNVTTNTK